MRGVLLVSTLLSLACADTTPFYLAPGEGNGAPTAAVTTSRGINVLCTFEYSTAEGDASADAGGGDLPPERALEQLSGRCLRFREAYWTYEVCVGGAVRQTHEAENFVLGTMSRFDGLSQYYTDGTPCDAKAGRPGREATVSFFCSPRTEVMSVIERSPCVYDVKVAAQDACASSSFPKANEAAGGGDSSSDEPWTLEVYELEDGSVSCEARHADDLRKGGYSSSAVPFASYKLRLSAPSVSDDGASFTATDAGARRGGREPVAEEELEVGEDGAPELWFGTRGGSVAGQPHALEMLRLGATVV